MEGCLFYCYLVMYKLFESVNEVESQKNQGGMIWRWGSSGLLSLVGYSYVRQLLWEWILLIAGNYFVMGLRDITLINLLVSENSWSNLLYIASKILFQMILRPRQRTYIPLMSLMKERHFPLRFSSSFSPYAEVRTIYDITLNSALLLDYTPVNCEIGYQHTYEKE